MDGELLGTVYRVDLILAGASILLGGVGGIILSHTGYAPQIAVVVVVLVIAGNLSAVVSPFGLALERELQLSRLTLVSVFSAVIAYGAAILLARAGAGIWSLLAMSLLSAVIAVAGVYLVCKRRLPYVFLIERRFSRSTAKRLLKQGLPAGLSSELISTVVNQFDNFLIGTFVGTATLGFYDRAYRTSQWPNILLTAALVRVGFLTFAKLQNDLPRLTHAVRLCIWVLTTVGIPLALAVFFGAADLVVVLYTSAWLPSAFFLRFLIVFSLISPYISLGSSLAYAQGNIRTTVVITVAQAVSLVALGVPLTLWLGAVGTVIAVGVTIAIGFGLSSAYIFHHLPLSALTEFGAPGIAVAVASCVTLLVFQLPGWEDLEPLPRLFATTIASAGSYSICLFALRPRTTIERVRYLVQTFRGERLTV